MIRLEGIGREYLLGETTVHALADVTETIERGEHVAIMGPSGSGKSTLLNIIGCLDRPTAGRMWLDGREVSQLDLSQLSTVRRELIGFVFQSYHLVPRLDAAGNVELPMIFAGVPRAERRRRVAEALAAVGLEDRMTHRPAQLSGGQRQRVAIARSTVMGPRILLADEPTGNLDTKAGNQVLDHLDKLNDEGLTMLVVTHDPYVAQRADRILVLVDGRIAKRVAASEVTDLSTLFDVSTPAASGATASGGSEGP